jgi:CRISPR system Cascade subunit CasA
MTLFHDLLQEHVFSVETADGRRVRTSLPGLLAGLTRDEVLDQPAVRPYQQHVWHAFLVQLAALHLVRSGEGAMPEDEDGWRAALMALTPEASDGAAWCLVTSPDRPAFLQPPVPGEAISGFKEVLTPDALDMLVTSRNHDVKQCAVLAAQVEHWVLALVSVQTQEGYMGPGYYGISRMNGGYSSRPALSVSAGERPGLRFARDCRRMVAARAELLRQNPHYPSKGGMALLWGAPWDGTTQLSLSDLDPFYIEVCRRIRLVQDAAGRLTARQGTSKVARVDAKGVAGNTGDGWTPLIPSGEGLKALSVTRESFRYDKLSALIFPSPSDPNAAVRAPLQVVASDDPASGLTMVFRGLVRGQGKTEGYFERHIPVSRTMRGFLRESATDRAAAAAAERVADAGLMARKVLYPALLSVFTAAPGESERTRDDQSAKDRAGRGVERFHAAVDAGFFLALDTELASSNPEETRAARVDWVRSLADAARGVLAEVAAEAPAAAMRHYRTRARSRDRLEWALRRHFGGYLGAAGIGLEAPVVQQVEEG